MASGTSGATVRAALRPLEPGITVDGVTVFFAGIACLLSRALAARAARSTGRFVPGYFSTFHCGLYADGCDHDSGSVAPVDAVPPGVTTEVAPVLDRACAVSRTEFRSSGVVTPSSRLYEMPLPTA